MFLQKATPSLAKSEQRITAPNSFFTYKERVLAAYTSKAGKEKAARLVQVVLDKAQTSGQVMCAESSNKMFYFIYSRCSLWQMKCCCSKVESIVFHWQQFSKENKIGALQGTGVNKCFENHECSGVEYRLGQTATTQ